MYVVLVLRRIREIFDFAPLILSIDGKMVSWQHWGVFPICEIHIFFFGNYDRTGQAVDKNMHYHRWAFCVVCFYLIILSAKGQVIRSRL
jgi:hypothetical protein